MSARGLTPAMAAAIAAGTVRVALFYEGEFNGGTVRFWSGVGPKTWNGQTWTGGGNLVGITPLDETAQLRSVGFTAYLSGMKASNIATALGAVRQGKPGTLWLAVLDASDAIIADPYQLQRGRLDVALIEDQGDTARISIQYESRLVDLERARTRRYTTEDQAIDYPDDLGFEFVPQLQDRVILWGPN